MDNNTPFPADAVTHATLLRDAGYRTAYFGKWHMGEQKGPRPGFDHSASFIGQGRYQDCPFEIDGVTTPTSGWVDDVSTDLAIDWLSHHRDRPFSIVVGYQSPHNRRGGPNLPPRLRWRTGSAGSWTAACRPSASTGSGIGRSTTLLRLR